MTEEKDNFVFVLEKDEDYKYSDHMAAINFANLNHKYNIIGYNNNILTFKKNVITNSVFYLASKVVSLSKF